jgi:TolA-binding protein
MINGTAPGSPPNDDGGGARATCALRSVRPHGLRRGVRGFSVSLIVALLFTATSVAQGDPYREAQAAFRAGEYEQALELLTIVYTNLQHSPAAPRSGLQAAALHFNLGATYFRLERYSAAAGQFRRIVHDPQLGMRARFTLGLIDAIAGNDDSAKAHFRAVGEASDSALRARAAAMLCGPLDVAPGDAPEFVAPHSP